METLTQTEEAGDEPPSGEHPALTDDEYALLFPGQGSQYVGMAGKVLRVYPDAEQWFTRANEVLDYDLLHLIEHGPSDELNQTTHSQPAIFVASVAWLEALRNKWDRAGRTLSPKVVSGHSMGQITALLAARAVEFDDALRLVRQRADLMHAADGQRPGGMASIIGLRDRVLRRLVGEAAENGTLVVANDNCPGQTVVSGDEAPLRRIMSLADENGARRVVRLPISIASHSPLMAGAQAHFSEAVHAVPWRDPVVPVVSNITGGLMHTKDQVAQELSEALTAPAMCCPSWSAGFRAHHGHSPSLTTIRDSRNGTTPTRATGFPSSGQQLFLRTTRRDYWRGSRDARR